MTLLPQPSTQSPWFQFESDYVPYHEYTRNWFVKYRSLSLLLGAIYLVLLYFGQRFMKNRQPFEIRKSLAAWNLFMFVFSAIFFFRVFNNITRQILYVGLYEQVCLIPPTSSEPLIFYYDLFALSKPIEYFDTLFIVLRKQPMHFLHYYHHVTVVVLCWFQLGLDVNQANCIYYVFMNSFIHTVMYLYYFLRSIRFPVPRRLQMSITVMQISQMIIGCYINIAALLYKLAGAKCDYAAYEALFMALAVYLSYFILFAHYFRKAYFSTAHHRHQLHKATTADSKELREAAKTD